MFFRQSAFIIEQVTMPDRTERLLKMSRTVLANRQQAWRKADPPEGFFIPDPGTHAFLVYQNYPLAEQSPSKPEASLTAGEENTKVTPWPPLFPPLVLLRLTLYQGFSKAGN
jgi:hypothetical protein